MRNILKLHSGTQSGTVVSLKKYLIFDDFENIGKILKRIIHGI
jgi:hypothetical protein